MLDNLIISTTDQNANHAEAQRVLNVCNACRYCEGFCAAFQALSLRQQVLTQDLDYLANLCHNCTACYHACQYSPPHAFEINAALALSRVRNDSYEAYAWPTKLAGQFQRNGLIVSIITAVALSLTMLAGLLLIDREVLYSQHIEAGAFYEIISHGLIVTLSSSIFLYSLLAIGIGARRFWVASGITADSVLNAKAVVAALAAAATLKHLGGGHGLGCNTESEQFSNQRRYFHQFTMWGFLLCFAATNVGTLYEYFLDKLSPFPYFSLPVILGTLGGIGLLIGPVGLTWLKLKSDPRPLNKKQYGMDYGFLALLFLVSLTGLALMVFRETRAMGMLFLIHFGFVLALFITLPYGKFVHAIYRLIALIGFHTEREKR